jgi:hypothetical protein
MDKGCSQSSKLLAVEVVAAWTVLAWWLVLFTAGGARSVADVLLNSSGEHLWVTLVVWLVAVSPAIGWWLLLTGRFKHF